LFRKLAIKNVLNRSRVVIHHIVALAADCLTLLFQLAHDVLGAGLSLKNVGNVLPAWIIFHLVLGVIGEFQGLHIDVQAARVVQDLRGGVVGRYLATHEHIQRGDALLTVQKDTNRALLFVIFMRPLQFRRACRLPGQHGAGRVFLDERVDQLLRVVSLPDILTLKSRNEQLVLVDLLQCRRNFHHNPFRAARALNLLTCFSVRRRSDAHQTKRP